MDDDYDDDRYNSDSDYADGVDDALDDYDDGDWQKVGQMFCKFATVFQMCYILEIKEMFGMDSNKTPSEIIAELCVEAGISKSELARRLEITPSQITRILNGDTKTISSRHTY